MAESRASQTAVVAAAICFGVTIPLSKLALDEASAPYLLVAVRFGLGGLLLLAAAFRRASVEGELRAVISCAVPLLLGYLALTVGLEQTASTTAAFLSYLLVVIVPVLSAVLYRQLPAFGVFVGIVLSVVGLWLLTGGAAGFGRGEALCLLAAVLFAVHVLVLGNIASTTRVDAVRLSAYQLLAVGVAAAPLGLAIDGPAQPVEWWGLTLLIAVVGVAALVLQTVGQREVGPSRTALILMIDPVVAAAGGYLIGERIGWSAVAGAALILAGIGVAELLTIRARIP